MSKNENVPRSHLLTPACIYLKIVSALKSTDRLMFAPVNKNHNHTGTITLAQLHWHNHTDTRPRMAISTVSVRALSEKGFGKKAELGILARLS